MHDLINNVKPANLAQNLLEQVEEPAYKSLWSDSEMKRIADGLTPADAKYLLSIVPKLRALHAQIMALDIATSTRQYHRALDDPNLFQQLSQHPTGKDQKLTSKDLVRLALRERTRNPSPPPSIDEDAGSEESSENPPSMPEELLGPYSALREQFKEWRILFVNYIPPDPQPNEWTCIDVDCPRAVVNVHRARLNESPRTCDHSALTCRCIIPDIIIADHLYKYTFDELVELFNRTTLLTLYLNVYTLKATKYYLQNNTVELIEDGPNMIITTPSSHRKVPSNRWLLTGYHPTVAGVPPALAWDIETTTHDVDLYLFAQAPLAFDNREPRSIDLDKALMDKTYVGEVTFSPEYGVDKTFNTQFERRSLPKVTAIESIKDKILLCFGIEKKTYLIPKDLIENLRTAVAGKPRDEHQFQRLLSICATKLRTLDCPQADKANAVTAATVIAFYYDVEHEFNLITTMQSHLGSTLGNLNDALKFTRVTGWWHDLKRMIQEDTFLALGTAAIGTLTAAALVRALSNSMTPKSVAQLTIGAIAATAAQKAHATMALPSWKLGLLRHTIFGTDIPSKIINGISIVVRRGLQMLKLVIPAAFYRIGSVVEHHASIIYANVCNEGKRLRPIAPKCSMAAPKEYECKPGFGLQQVGPTTSYRTPLMARKCIHNAILAVRNRCIAVTPDPEPGAYDEIYDFLINYGRLLTLNQGRKIRPMPREQWLRRFPPARRAMLEEAWDQMRREGYTLEQLSMVLFFVKAESILKCYPEYTELYEPRAIQGSTPGYQNLHGPFTLAYANCLKVTWGRQEDGEYWQLAYSSGMNATELGRWFEEGAAHLFNKYGRIGIGKGDAERFDMHLHLDGLRVEMRIYSHYTTRKQQRIMEAQLKTVATGPFGIKFNYVGRRGSGRSNTSSGNTTINGGCYGNAYKKLKVQDYRANIQGDDNITIMPWTDLLRVKEHIAIEFKRYGFILKFEISDSLYDAEFCSGRFYPTDRGTIFGPKIGRILTKLYYSKTELPTLNQQAEWLRGVALGAVHDHNHIPILRTLHAKVLNLTEGVKAKPINEINAPHVERPANPCAETYIMLEHIYGVPKHHFDDVEAFIWDNMKTACCTITHPVLQTILDVDVPREKDHEYMAMPVITVGGPDVTTSTALAFLAPIYNAAIHAPFAEEIATHITTPMDGYLLRALIVCAETIDCIAQGHSITNRIIPTLLHVVCQLLPLQFSIPLHYCHNGIVLMAENNRLTKCFGLCSLALAGTVLWNGFYADSEAATTIYHTIWRNASIGLGAAAINLLTGPTRKRLNKMAHSINGNMEMDESLIPHNHFLEGHLNHYHSVQMTNCPLHKEGYTHEWYATLHEARLMDPDHDHEFMSVPNYKQPRSMEAIHNHVIYLKHVFDTLIYPTLSPALDLPCSCYLNLTRRDCFDWLRHDELPFSNDYRHFGAISDHRIRDTTAVLEPFPRTPLHHPVTLNTEGFARWLTAAPTKPYPAFRRVMVAETMETAVSAERDPCSLLAVFRPNVHTMSHDTTHLDIFYCDIDSWSIRHLIHVPWQMHAHQSFIATMDGQSILANTIYTTRYTDLSLAHRTVAGAAIQSPAWTYLTTITHHYHKRVLIFVQQDTPDAPLITLCVTAPAEQVNTHAEAYVEDDEQALHASYDESTPISWMAVVPLDAFLALLHYLPRIATPAPVIKWQ